MNKICLLALMTTMVLSGCAESSSLIKTGSNSIQTDVFQELSNGGIVPEGYADLRVTSSVKTHKFGIYPPEKKSHGTSEYRLLINIDGQALQLQGDLQKENTEPLGIRDPEAGDGIRYRFNKNVRLKAGTHKIIVALPYDDIAAQGEFTLSDKSNNSLVAVPSYGASPGQRRPGFSGVTSFREGVKRLWLTLNGQNV
jgi:hypothetical protein